MWKVCQKRYAHTGDLKRYMLTRRGDKPHIRYGFTSPSEVTHEATCRRETLKLCVEVVREVCSDCGTNAG